MSAQLSKLASIAEIIAAIAVVVSLIYVGAEVQQNTNAIQAASFQEIVHASDAYLMELATDGELVSIMIQGETDASSLNDVERRRYLSIVRILWRNMENVYLQNKRGLIGEDEWSGYERIICEAAQSHRPTWDWHRYSLSPAFQSVVESCWPGEST